jgi:hypothetical protein
VFDHVLRDVRALQRNDLKLACLMAVYCEEFCSCEQLKQVSRGDAMTVAVAQIVRLRLTRRQILRLLDDSAIRLKFASFVFSRSAVFFFSRCFFSPANSIVDPSNKSIWTRTFSLLQRQVCGLNDISIQSHTAQTHAGHSGFADGARSSLHL